MILLHGPQSEARGRVALDHGDCAPCHGSIAPNCVHNRTALMKRRLRQRSDSAPALPENSGDNATANPGRTGTPSLQAALIARPDGSPDSTGLQKAVRPHAIGMAETSANGCMDACEMRRAGR